MRNTRSSQIKIKYETIRILFAWIIHSAIRYSFFCVGQKLLFNEEKVHIRSPPNDSSYQKNQNGESKMKDIKYIIADNVKIYRKKKNLTQVELAELADLSLDSIKRIEGGKITLSLENFIRIANALEVPLSFFMYEQISIIPETEIMLCILDKKNDKQREYLLHMLQEMADGMEKLYDIS